MHAGSGHTRARRLDPLALAAAGLAAVAFAGSFTHVHAVVSEHGQVGWIGYAIALMPEASVGLVVLKISRARRTTEPVTWAWLVGITAATFTMAANLADAEDSVWGYVAAGWPAWSSISALGLMHTGGRAHRVPDTPVHTPGTHLVHTVHAYSDTPVHTPDTSAVHASDTVPDTPVHAPVHVSGTPVEHTSDTPSSTPVHAPVHTPDTGAVHASDTPPDTPVHTDTDTLRTQDVHTVRGAMRALGCGQARAKAALERAWT